MIGRKTRWLPADVLPVRAGVYERDYSNPGRPRGEVVVFCRYDGGAWYTFEGSAAQAARSTVTSSNLRPWRGLAVDPHLTVAA